MSEWKCVLHSGEQRWDLYLEPIHGNHGMPLSLSSRMCGNESAHSQGHEWGEVMHISLPLMILTEPHTELQTLGGLC